MSETAARIARVSTDRRRMWNCLRIATTVAAAGYAACLWPLSVTTRLLALLVLLDIAAGLLMWRIDRRIGSTRGRLAEDSGYLVVFALVIVTVAVTQPAWTQRLGQAYWYALAPVAGLLLIRLSGLRPRSLFSGELAFLAGPKPWSLALLNCVVLAFGAVAEEALYRGGALSATGVLILPVALLGALVFCGKHHLPMWSERRWNLRILSFEAASAAVFVALAVGSGSIYPAILAHLTNNVPPIALQIQRARSGGDDVSD